MRKLLSAALVSTVLVSSLYGVAAASTTQVKTNGATLTKAFFTGSVKNGKPGKPITTIHISKPAYLIMTWTNVAPPANFGIGLCYQGTCIPASSTQPLTQSGTYEADLTGAFKSVPSALYGSGWGFQLIMNKKVVKTLNFSIQK